MFELFLQRKVAVFLFVVASLYIGFLVGESQMMLPAIFLGGLGAIFLYQAARYYFALVVVLTMLPGRGLILFGFGYWDSLALIVVALTLIQYLHDLTRFRLRSGLFTFLCISVFCSILIAHPILNKMGSGSGGGGGLRLGVVALATILVAYFVLCDGFSKEGNDKIPLLGLAPGVFEAGIELINIAFPWAVIYTFYVYSSINWETIQSVVSTGEVEVSRLSGLRSLGLSVGLFSAVYFCRPKRLLMSHYILGAGGMVVALGLVVFSGYRGFVLALLIIGFLAVWYRSRIWAVVGFFGILVLFSMVSFVHSEIMPMPRPVQRSLSWFPGKWDGSVVIETESGWIWRRKVWTFFMDHVYPAHPWFGQGQLFSPEDKITLNYMTLEEYFAYNQNTHSGFFSTLDFVGGVGAAALILGALRSYYLCFILLCFRRRDLKPWMLWIIFYYLSWQPRYWITGFYEQSFMVFGVSMAVIEFIMYQIAHPSKYQSGGSEQISP